MKFPAGALLVSCFLSFPIMADVLLVDVIAQEPPNTQTGLLRPTRGMSMDRVLQKFGEPEQRQGPVGNPPISRWVYPDYNVYFERNLVLTSVVSR